MSWKKMARLLRIQTCLLVISMTLTILLLLDKTYNDDEGYKLFLQSITTSTSQDYNNNLLPPKLFGPESCLSRQQSSSYRTRQSLSHKPSSYLLSKLRSYEHLHRRCGPYTDAYNRTVHYLLQSTNNNTNAAAAGIPTTDCNYLVWYPFSGLGNRIISLASAFLYALLTDRVLLVNFGSDMSDLFCEPFPYSSWLLPQNFPYKSAAQIRDLPTFHSVIAARQRNNWQMPISVPPAVHAYLEHGAGRTRFFHCDESHQLITKVPVLILASDVYFTPSLFMTPTYLPELNNMFPPQTMSFPSVFHHLGHYLFLPSNQAWKIITDYYDTNLSQADIRVGLQLRIFKPKPKSSPPDTMLHQILTCTQNNSNILPKVNTQIPKPNNSTSSSSAPTKAILIASLYSQFADGLRLIYNTSQTTDGTEILGVYQPSNEGHQRFQDKGQNIKAWVEMYMLSLCDELVTSAQSTFGYVAQGLGGVQSWVLTRNDDDDSACKRAPTIDPCFHAPPKFNCKTKGGIDRVSDLFPNIERCDDYPNGVRLSSTN